MIAITILLGCTTLLFFATTVFLWLTANTLTFWMKKNGYTPPTKEETKECAEIVIRKKLNKFRNGF